MPSNDTTNRGVLVWQRANGERVEALTIRAGDTIQIGESEPVTVSDGSTAVRPHRQGFRRRWLAGAAILSGLLAAAAMARSTPSTPPARPSTEAPESAAATRDGGGASEGPLIAEAIQRATTSDLNPVDVLFEEGLQQQRVGRLRDAAMLLTAVLARDPQHALAKTRLAEVRVELEQSIEEHTSGAERASAQLQYEDALREAELVLQLTEATDPRHARAQTIGDAARARLAPVGTVAQFAGGDAPPTRNNGAASSPRPVPPRTNPRTPPHRDDKTGSSPKTPDPGAVSELDRARAAFERADYTAAISILEAAMKTEPDAPGAGALLARAREALRSLAQQAFESATTREAGRDWSVALAEYERARALDPSLPGIAVAIQRVRDLGQKAAIQAFSDARVYDAKSQVSDAVQQYERALQGLASDDPRRKQVADRLAALKAERQ